MCLVDLPNTENGRIKKKWATKPTKKSPKNSGINLSQRK